MLASAIEVRLPVAVFAGVVQIEHRGDRINAQAVDVELLEPVDSVGNQEVTHLRTAEVEDVRAPVGLVAASRVRMLVQGLSVKTGERKRIFGEVGRNPVEQNADSIAVHGVHEVPEVIR